jgi:hypothetical protein
MKAILVAFVLGASPVFAQEFTASATLMQQLTGPDAQAGMQALDICSTDLGTMTELNDTIVIAFGDTFGWQGDACQKFGPNAIGTPCGRSNGARAARVEAEKLQQTAAWEYWDGEAWSNDRAQAAEIIKPGVGEGSLVWNAGIKRWMYATLNVLSSALELRFAERPEGPWSPPAVLASASDYSLPYGAFMTPAWIAEDGLSFSFIMSQFGLYNTYVMKAELQRAM